MISLSHADDVALIRPWMDNEDKDRLMDIIVREVSKALPHCIKDPSLLDEDDYVQAAMYEAKRAHKQLQASKGGGEMMQVRVIRVIS